MVKPVYENQLIGAFLYGLGLFVGRQGHDLEVTDAVSLLQQTPLDAPLGDLLLAKAQRAYLIEFKRTWKEVAAEAPKRDFLRDRMDADLLARMRPGHLLAYGPKQQQQSVPLTIEPYFSDHPGEEGWSFEAFADSFLIGGGGVDAAEFRDYLKQLLEGAGSAGGAGILVVQTPEGRTCFQSVASLTELSLLASQHFGPPKPPPGQTQKIRGPSRGM